MEKKESPKGERAVKPVISLPSKKWVLKIALLIMTLIVFYNHFFSIRLYAIDYISVNGLPLIFIILYTNIKIPKVLNITFVLSLL